MVGIELTIREAHNMIKLIGDKEYEYCLRCGRKLKNSEARKIGYGVVCLKKMKTDVQFKPLLNLPNKHII